MLENRQGLTSLTQEEMCRQRTLARQSILDTMHWQNRSLPDNVELLSVSSVVRCRISGATDQWNGSYSTDMHMLQ